MDSDTGKLERAEASRGQGPARRAGTSPPPRLPPPPGSARRWEPARRASAGMGTLCALGAEWRLHQ
jgi:hypothetical protein